MEWIEWMMVWVLIRKKLNLFTLFTEMSIFLLRELVFDTFFIFFFLFPWLTRSLTTVCVFLLLKLITSGDGTRLWSFPHYPSLSNSTSSVTSTTWYWRQYADEVDSSSNDEKCCSKWKIVQTPAFISVLHIGTHQLKATKTVDKEFSMMDDDKRDDGEFYRMVNCQLSVTRWAAASESATKIIKSYQVNARSSW